MSSTRLPLSFLLGLVLACSTSAGSPTPGPGLGPDDETSGSTTQGDPQQTDPTLASADTTHGNTSVDPSTSTGDATETDPTDPDDTGPSETPLQRHTLNVSTGQWTSAALDDVWTGPQAPPSVGILATASMTSFDRLLVLADDGYVYQRAQGAWLPPVLTDDHFAVLAGRIVDAIAHVPSPEDPTVEDLFLIADHHAVIYNVFDSGNVSFVDDVPLSDVPGGPPHASGRPRWAITRTDPASFGQATWLEWFYLYDDDVLYYSDATAEWVAQWPALGNEFFMGAAGEPDPRTASAAWYDDQGLRLHVIAP